MCQLYNKSRILTNCKRIVNENNLLTSWTKRQTLFFDVSDNTELWWEFSFEGYRKKVKTHYERPRAVSDIPRIRPFWLIQCCTEEAGSKLVPPNSPVMPFDKTLNQYQNGQFSTLQLLAFSSLDTCPFIYSFVILQGDALINVCIYDTNDRFLATIVG